MGRHDKSSYNPHRNSYSKGVLNGNWEEERQPAANAPARVEGESVSQSTYSRQGKEWQTLQYERKDWDRTHACSGRDTILRHAEPNQSVPPAYTTLNQLAYGAPSAQHPQVQKLLWTGHKENELRMPAAKGRCDLVRAKRQAWEHDVADSPWLTSSRLAADAAAMGGAGASCKRQGCRPAAEGGQPAQIGRKAVGDCAQLFDKTWIQIGLRK